MGSVCFDLVIIFWTVNTERYSNIVPGVNDAAAMSSQSSIIPTLKFPLPAFSLSQLSLRASLLSTELPRTPSFPASSRSLNATPQPVCRGSVQEQGDQYEQRRRRHGRLQQAVVQDHEIGPKGVLISKGEHSDHTVVIKYVPAVGDSKRAIDEYYSEIFCGEKCTFNIFNECEVRCPFLKHYWVIS